MNYTEAWNKIVGYYEKYGTALEAVVQAVWEDSVFSAILNYDTAEIDSQRAVQMGSTKKMDIVIRLDGTDSFVVELKRYAASASDGGQAQLFSYLNQLKSVGIGMLVCNSLYVYDYDFTKSDEENAENHLEIPFERDNPCGAKFVELFSRENFNAENIKEYIRTKRKNSENSSLILGEISEAVARAALKNYFLERFPEEDVEAALDKIAISVGMKSVRSHSVSPVAVRTHGSAEVDIKGHAFDLYVNPQHGDTLFQDFVRRTLTDLLRWNLIPAAELERLQETDYSKKTFGLQFALFQREWRDCLDNTGKARYWSKKIGAFYVCSQWWKDNVVPVYEGKFADWLEYLSRLCGNG